MSKRIGKYKVSGKEWALANDLDQATYSTGNITVSGDADIGGAAKEVGFYGVAGVTKQAGGAQAAAGAITAYSAHASGGTPVTSAGATDLDSTAAAVATLRAEVAANVVLLNEIRQCLVDLGLIAGS